MIHLLIHWLDDLRAQGDGTFSWNVVRGNIGAWPYQAALAALIAYAVWPPLRKRVHAFVDKKLAPVHEAIAHVHRHIESATGVPVPPKPGDET